MAAPFFWYELITDDVAGATAFYQAVVGWGSDAWGGPQPYMIMKAGEHGVGGIMEIPPEAKAMGARPAWLGYVHATDVDATCEALTRAGGKVERAPADIPEIGRFAVVSDPHGAHFMLMSPIGEDRPPLASDAPGNVGWRELMAGDLETAWTFYSTLFGWSKLDAIDMGPMGTYQLFSSGGEQQGGMMTKPDSLPHPFWTFYFNVSSIDAAADRVKANGGQIVMEPMQVPGGSWVVQASDPQGAIFALVAPAR